jgi:Tol biopolymer transport system component
MAAIADLQLRSHPMFSRPESSQSSRRGLTTRRHILRLSAAGLVSILTPNATSHSTAIGDDTEVTLKGKIVLFAGPRAGGAKGSSIQVMSRDGSIEMLAEFDGIVDKGLVSFDGRHAAFELYGDAKEPDVWIVNARGSGRRLLAERVSIACWSPRGDSIVCHRGGYGQWQHFSVNVDSQKVEPLNLPATDFVCDFSPDGVELLTVSVRDDGKRQICRVRPDGSGRVSLTEPDTDNIHPRFSPDGRRIVFSSRRTGRVQLYVMDHDGSHVRQLTRFDAKSPQHPCWSPDGKEIACLCFKLRPANEGFEVYNPHILVMNDDGSDPKDFLPADGLIGRWPDWR